MLNKIEESHKGEVQSVRLRITESHGRSERSRPADIPQGLHPSYWASWEDCLDGCLLRPWRMWDQPCDAFLQAITDWAEREPCPRDQGRIWKERQWDLGMSKMISQLNSAWCFEFPDPLKMFSKETHDDIWAGCK